MRDSLHFRNQTQDMIKQLLTSKKFTTSAAGIIFVVLNETLGWAVPEKVVYSIVGLIVAYVLGQGQADKEKESTKLQIAYDKQKTGRSR